VYDAPGAIELVVTADTRYLPAPRAEGLLRGVEALLVEAACGDGARVAPDGYGCGPRLSR
jgi:hypothetical protein